MNVEKNDVTGDASTPIACASSPIFAGLEFASGVSDGATASGLGSTASFGTFMVGPWPMILARIVNSVISGQWSFGNRNRLMPGYLI